MPLRMRVRRYGALGCSDRAMVMARADRQDSGSSWLCASTASGQAGRSRYNQSVRRGVPLVSDCWIAQLSHASAHRFARTIA
jgi:hypothetical protein